MKKNLIFVFLLITTCLMAQSPQSFKYQALLRDKNGVLIMDKNVSVRIGILQGSITGTSVYSETHSVKTSTSGTINLEIGKGTLPIGTFTSIAWGKNSFFVKIEMDPLGGSAFELVGTSQLLSVPYALYAEKSGDEKWGITPLTNDIYYTAGKVGIGTTTPASGLDIQGSNPSIGIKKIQIKSTDSENKGRMEMKSDPADLGNVYSTSLDRIGDSSEDLLFGLQQPVNNTKAWNIFESWRGAGLMVSASGPDLAPLTFGIDRIEKARLSTNGNFGIGTANPLYKLDVSGTVNATEYLLNGSPLNLNSSQWNLTGSDISYSSGQVSIGTSSQVSRSSLYIDTPIPTSDSNKSNGIFVNASDVISRGLPVWIRSNTTNLTYGTNVGNTLGRLLRLQDQRFGQEGVWDFGIDVNKSFFISGGSSSDFTKKFILSSNGNIGIGTVAPASKLDVNGGINATQYLLNGTPVNFAPSQWNTSSGNISYSTGKVGIGTTTPVSNLDIQGLNATSGLYKTQFKGTESEGKGRLDIKSDPSDIGNLYSTSLNRFGDSSEDLVFGLQQPVGNSTSWNILESWRGAGLLISASGPDLAPLVLGIDRVEKARLNTNGNFGIGTPDPKSKLQVENGDIYINSVSAGVIMKSPNGQCWRMTVSDAGAPVFTATTCPQ